MTAWHSLYLFSNAPDDAASHLRETLTHNGYHPYNPFGLMPSKPWKQTVRLFVAPARGGWLRVIGEPTAEVEALLSQHAPLLSLGLRGDTAHIAAYADGAKIDVQAFAARTMAIDARTIERALHDASLMPLPKKQQQQVVAIPMDQLPEDVRAMAQRINPAQAGGMIEKLSGDLMKRVGGDAAAAGALLNPPDAPDWGSVGAARLRAMAQALSLGSDWDAPDFVTLRDAYQAAARRQRKPDAPLFPGDADALAAVPDALAYTPVFGGRDG
ncbi:MAG: hypothetical protein SF123_00875 [Chloroflexota bacterium]|nr:hypothetical protein [Chloroflexota bacterium]